MVNQEYYNLGTAPSVIRQLFAYGLEQVAKVTSPDTVYDVMEAPFKEAI